MSASLSTTDHDTIRKWAAARGGRPAHVKGTQRDSTGIIRILFPDAPQSRHDELEEISWKNFFKKLDEKNLCLVYQEETRGNKSHFHKLVSREDKV